MSLGVSWVNKMDKRKKKFCATLGGKGKIIKCKRKLVYSVGEKRDERICSKGVRAVCKASCGH